MVRGCTKAGTQCNHLDHLNVVLGPRGEENVAFLQRLMVSVPLASRQLIWVMRVVRHVGTFLPHQEGLFWVV